MSHSLVIEFDCPKADAENFFRVVSDIAAAELAAVGKGQITTNIEGVIDVRQSPESAVA